MIVNIAFFSFDNFFKLSLIYVVVGTYIREIDYFRDRDGPEISIAFFVTFSNA